MVLEVLKTLPIEFQQYLKLYKFKIQSFELNNKN